LQALWGYCFCKRRHSSCRVRCHRAMLESKSTSVGILWPCWRAGTSGLCLRVRPSTICCVTRAQGGSGLMSAAESSASCMVPMFMKLKHVLQGYCRASTIADGREALCKSASCPSSSCCRPLQVCGQGLVFGYRHGAHHRKTYN
jgi:hypothetical protein